MKYNYIGKRSTESQQSYVREIAKKNGWAVDESRITDFIYCRDFLNQNSHNVIGGYGAPIRSFSDYRGVIVFFALVLFGLWLTYHR